MSFVGSGIGYRAAHHAALVTAADVLPDLLEVIPEHFFADAEALRPLAERYPIVFHEVGLSIGTKDDGRTSRALLARIRELASIARPLIFSDHLAITRSPDGTDLGHLAPICFTEEALAFVGERVRMWQDTLGVPIALENIAAPFVIQEADLTEAEFFARLVSETGCAMLLDLTNLLANARNFGFDAAARLAEYPLEAVLQVHLAGGFVQNGFCVDSHSEPVDDDSYALLAALRGRSPLRAIVIERDEKLPCLSELVFEARRATETWNSP